MIVIKRPVITEKSLKQSANGSFTFIVDRKAEKRQIALAVEKQFSVEVVSIKTSHFKDEIKMQRSRRGSFVNQGYKKAIVELKKGQKIALFEPQKEEVEAVTTAEGEPIEVKEKKSLLKGTKVKIERMGKKSSTDTKKAGKNKE